MNVAVIYLKFGNLGKLNLILSGAGEPSRACSLGPSCEIRTLEQRDVCNPESSAIPRCAALAWGARAKAINGS